MHRTRLAVNKSEQMKTANGGEAVEIRFSEGIFTVEAVKKSAYSMADRLNIEIASRGGEIICIIRSSGQAETLLELEQDFRRQVLDYDLRAQIAKETEPTRNLILALAFSKTGVQG